jgi:hypothetical protein
MSRPLSRPIRAALASFALVLVACTDGGSSDAEPRSEAGQAARITDGLLALETPSGVTLLDGRGEIVREVPGATPAPDWSAIVSAAPADGSTTLERIDAATGETLVRAEVPGEWEIRAVAGWGEVALMPPRPAGADPFAPDLKATTEIALVDPADPAAMRRFELDGNFEPEAFSHEGDRQRQRRSLFLLRYSPTMAPESYRVTGLTLEGRREGQVFDVSNALEKGVVENMTATRLEQELAPGGEHLLTLYTNQPASYLTGAGKDPAHEVAFVHALNLKWGYAMCIGLPKGFVGLEPDQVAIAATDFGRVFAVDVAHGRVAIVNLDDGRARMVPLDLDGIGKGPVTAGLSADGATLLVGASQGLVAFDAWSLERIETVGTPAAVTGFASPPDGDGPFLSWDGGLGVLDLETFRIEARLPSPAAGPIEAVLAA